MALPNKKLYASRSKVTRVMLGSLIPGIVMLGTYYYRSDNERSIVMMIGGYLMVALSGIISISLLRKPQELLVLTNDSLTWKANSKPRTIRWADIGMISFSDSGPIGNSEILVLTRFESEKALSISLSLLDESGEELVAMLKRYKAEATGR
jgi:hypothetical protein